MLQVRDARSFSEARYGRRRGFLDRAWSRTVVGPGDSLRWHGYLGAVLDEQPGAGSGPKRRYAQGKRNDNPPERRYGLGRRIDQLHLLAEGTLVPGAIHISLDLLTNLGPESIVNL